jgi:opacity protein-like surface antigen
MKKAFAFLAVLFVLGTTFASAQPVPGKKLEFGTSVAFFSYKPDDATSAVSYLSIPFRLGWFFWKGLEIEPEFLLSIPTFSGGGDMSYFIGGNLTYNFGSGTRLIPFIGGGAGIGNGIPFFGLVEGDSDQRVFAFDGVAGLKYVIGDVAALRAEYRLTRYIWKDTVLDEEEKGLYLQIFLGLSIFF